MIEPTTRAERYHAAHTQHESFDVEVGPRTVTGTVWQPEEGATSPGEVGRNLVANAARLLERAFVLFIKE